MIGRPAEAALANSQNQTPYRLCRAAVRQFKLERHRLQTSTAVDLNHKVQVRPGAEAGVARAPDPLAALDPLAIANADAAIVQVSIQGHARSEERRVGKECRCGGGG